MLGTDSGEKKRMTRKNRQKAGQIPPVTAIDWFQRNAADVGISLVLLVATFLLYIPSLSNGFLKWDDNEYVTANSVVQGGLSPSSIYWAFTTNRFANWLPITWLSHLLDVSLFGLNPAGHHATNNLLHSVNASLLFCLLIALSGARWRSLAAAVLFAVHPLRVESVSWIAERKDVLAATFFLLTLLAYVRFSKHRSWGSYLLAILLCALGMMSKTMLVTVPGVLLLLDWWPLRRWLDRRPEAKTSLGDRSSHAPDQPGLVRIFLEKLPFAVISLIACIWTVALQRSGGMLALNSLPFDQRVGNAIVAIPRYLKKTIWPSDLAAFYSHPGAWSTSVVVASLILVIALTAGAAWLRRRMPYLLFGWLWFLGMLVPVIGIIQAGEQSIADRYMYLPGIGLIIAVVWGVTAFASQRRWSRKPALWITGVATALLVIATVKQQSTWVDTYSVFANVLKVEPDNWLAHSYVGSEVAARGEIHAAMGHYRRAIELNPDFAHARYNLGNALIKIGRFADAEVEYTAAVRIDPKMTPAHYNLAVLAGMRRNFPEAVTRYETALKTTPNYTEAQIGLAGAYRELGRLDEAAAQLKNVLDRDPGNLRARQLLQQLQATTSPVGSAPGSSTGNRR